jgi:hypothetical protein
LLCSINIIGLYWKLLFWSKKSQNQPNKTAQLFFKLVFISFWNIRQLTHTALIWIQDYSAIQMVQNGPDVKWWNFQTPFKIWIKSLDFKCSWSSICLFNIWNLDQNVQISNGFTFHLKSGLFCLVYKSLYHSKSEQDSVQFSNGACIGDLLFRFPLYL